MITFTARILRLNKLSGKDKYFEFRCCSLKKLKNTNLQWNENNVKTLSWSGINILYNWTQSLITSLNTTAAITVWYIQYYYKCYRNVFCHNLQ